MLNCYKKNSRIYQKNQQISHAKLLIRRYRTTLLPKLKKYAGKNISQHQETLSTSLKLKSQVV